MPRIKFIRVQKDLWKDTPLLAAETLVQNFRLHYPNLASFASSISRFKSELRKEGAPEEYLALLRPKAEETAEVQATNRKRLDLKCQRSVTLKQCGDNLIMYFRQCLESNELGKLVMGIQACTGLRMVETVCRAEIDTPVLTHETDDIYWAYVKGVCKKQNNDFIGHERPLLHRRDIIQSAIERLRKNHFPDLQQCDDNRVVSEKACRKINRSIRKCWPYPEVKMVTSHFFRSFYVACSFHYFNKNSSINMWASDVLCHESMHTSFAYTGLLIQGFGSLCFNADRQLQGMARLSV
jgi:hypothetical protein